MHSLLRRIMTLNVPKSLHIALTANKKSTYKVMSTSLLKLKVEDAARYYEYR